jgi:protein HIRA/HIR1
MVPVMLQIVERDGFKVDKDFVGHRKAVTCVRFNNNIYERTGNGKAAMFLYMAIGGQLFF